MCVCVYSVYMPRYNIYIRKENEDKWAAIPDKSNWINVLLANSGDTSRYGAKRDIAGETFVDVLTEVPDPIKTPAEAKKVVGKLSKPQGYCEHGYSYNMCKFAKCRAKA